MPRHLKQRGAAIIVALFVMSLVAIAAIAMMQRLHLDVRRTELFLNATRGNFYAQGSIAWAMEQLNNNFRLQQPNKIIDATPIHSPVDSIENATIMSTITDAQGRFNVNNLSDPAYSEDFIRLVQAVEPTLDATAIHNMISAINDWITVGKINTPFDAYYLKLNPPYRAPHRLMVSISELRLIKGMTAELFAKLVPYITALPEVTKININNTSPPVLVSLSPALTLESAQMIITAHAEAPFMTTAQFQQQEEIKQAGMPNDKITVASSYFLVETNVKVGQQQTLIYTLLQRMLKNAQPTEVVLWQSKGTL